MHRSGPVVMAWNVFKFCTALRAFGSLMILLVLGIVGVSYYSVVVANYGPALGAGGIDSLLALAVLILFHVLVLDSPPRFLLLAPERYLAVEMLSMHCYFSFSRLS
ncbi:hypothetical protein BHM03_00037245 [Ensete ventricosum]|nr:hypothetical protein BHM03_00037245 [Ensete ventricosum]